MGCDETSHRYEITASTAVYRKVCGQLASRTRDNHGAFQTVQRLADSWRTAIGSTGISVVLAFCDPQSDLVDSDEECVVFADHFLTVSVQKTILFGKGYRFLY
jgi:hypothetical protein